MIQPNVSDRSSRELWTILLGRSALREPVCVLTIFSYYFEPTIQAAFRGSIVAIVACVGLFHPAL